VCTATWIATQDGYEVLFNRDELRTRKPALPPAVRQREGMRFLSPEDGDAGGTWIGANELGLSIGLANGPVGAGGRGSGAREFRSRGLLVLDLLAAADLAEVERRLRSVDPSIHRPFALFAIQPGREAELWRSDGGSIARLPDGGGGAILLTSSRDDERARKERGALLDRMKAANAGLDPELLARFHRSHEPDRGAFSPCMHREDASTVSLTLIRVGALEVGMEYRDGPPCESTGSSSVRLPRRAV
jgi:hypothetical protein